MAGNKTDRVTDHMVLLILAGREAVRYLAIGVSAVMSKNDRERGGQRGAASGTRRPASGRR